VCDPADHVATPAGRLCLDCGMVLGEADAGFLIPHVRASGDCTEEPWHLDCFLRSVGVAPPDKCTRCGSRFDAKGNLGDSYFLCDECAADLQARLRSDLTRGGKE